MTTYKAENGARCPVYVSEGMKKLYTSRKGKYIIRKGKRIYLAEEHSYIADDGKTTVYQWNDYHHYEAHVLGDYVNVYWIYIPR